MVTPKVHLIVCNPSSIGIPPSPLQGGWVVSEPAGERSDGLLGARVRVCVCVCARARARVLNCVSALACSRFACMCAHARVVCRRAGWGGVGGKAHSPEGPLARFRLNEVENGGVEHVPGTSDKWATTVRSVEGQRPAAEKPPI